MSTNKIAIQTQTEFKMARLESIREVTESENNAFLTRHGVQNNRIFYLSKYTSTIAMELTREEILSMAQDEEISDFSLYTEPQYISDTCKAADQIGVGSGTTQQPGLKSDSFGNLKGNGVKIGIIEYKGRYNPKNPQLKALHDSGQLCYVGNSANAPIDSHADLVTSIICGQKKRYLLNPYFEGIATDSQVYFCAIDNTLSDTENFMGFVSAFEWFAFIGVDVINMSVSMFTNDKYGERGSYRDFDREADRLINQTKIILIKSAGNDNNLRVSSPGLAYNAVTVGNAVTKNGKYKALTPPYDISSSSCYVVDSHLTNKPEIVAPGTEIASKISSQVYCASGTSFAAPFVTGLVAQLIQKYGASVARTYFPQFFKGLLMLGAEHNKIVDNDYRTGDGYCVSNKGGAGLVNGVRSASSNIHYKNFTVNLANGIPDFETTVIHNSSSSQYLTVRAILVFSKSENVSLLTRAYATDFNLKAKSGVTTLASSCSTYNNYEIVEFFLEPNSSVSLDISVSGVEDSCINNSLSLLWMTYPRGW